MAKKKTKALTSSKIPEPVSVSHRRLKKLLLNAISGRGIGALNAEYVEKYTEEYGEAYTEKYTEVYTDTCEPAEISG